ncbi:hypothetical protein HLB35_15600 [Halomonas sp. TBZ9]|uniref:Uncharacterized protein n=1 Tax=Vreelandella azerica TaxID=2732867 RepID=A0A7Y3TZB8_9GAMM|nr:hypothetical protein [Halomonas azerica]NOG32823.1 hypothetical protein [Halomonas azerica]
MAGAATIAVQSGVTQAGVADIHHWQSDDVAISAQREGWSVLGAAAIAIAKGAKGAGVAGSASALVSTRTVDARLLNIRSGSAGHLNVQSQDAANTILISGAVAASGMAGVGASAAVSYIEHEVTALARKVGDSSGVAFEADGISVEADSDALIISVAASLGIGGGQRCRHCRYGRG